MKMKFQNSNLWHASRGVLVNRARKKEKRKEDREKKKERRKEDRKKERKKERKRKSEQTEAVLIFAFES